MAFVTRLITRTSQPQGLVGLSDWARSAGFKTAILPGRVITGNPNAKWISSNGTPVTMANAKGKVSKYVNNADVFYDGGCDDPSTGYVVAVYGCFSSVGTWSGLFSRNKDSGTTNGLAWQRDGAGNTLRVGHGGTAVFIGSFNDLLDSTPRMWVFGWDRASLSLSLYRDGVLVRSGSTSAFPEFIPGDGRIRLASSRDVSASSAEISFTAFATGVGPTLELAKNLFENPWAIFEPETVRIWIDDATTVAPPGDPTGTLSANETGQDTAVLSGQIVVQGTLSASDTGQDTAAFSGNVIVTGTLAATETGSDTAALNGSASVTLTGTLAATEQGSDTSTLTGKLLVQGALSATEVGSDTVLINGSSVVITTGTLNAQESGGDTASMTGKVLVTGVLSGQELGSDTASLAGAAAVTGVRYWNGATWAYGTLRYWNGSVWATGSLRYWNGTNWSIP